MIDVRINIRWIKHRLTTRCRHEWIVGSTKTGHKACAKCGTWRWFPIIRSHTGTEGGGGHE
jgi:hypothetical protein